MEYIVDVSGSFNFLSVPRYRNTRTVRTFGMRSVRCTIGERQMSFRRDCMERRFASFDFGLRKDKIDHGH